MVKTPRLKYVERGMLSAQGGNITQAKAALDEKIESALNGSYEPQMLTYGSYTAVMYRTPDGWSYKMMMSDEVIKPGIVDVHYGAYQGIDRYSCIQNAAFHVLDLGSTPDEFHSDGDIPSWLTEPDKRRTVLSNARFRRAYWWAKENTPDGADNDHEWHKWACNHERDERFA